MTKELAREIFKLWPTWAEIVEYVSVKKPVEAEPQSIFGAACACEFDRLVARVYGSGVGETWDEAEALVGEVLDMAMEGQRPRFGREVGLTAEAFRIEGEAS